MTNDSEKLGIDLLIRYLKDMYDWIDDIVIDEISNWNIYLTFKIKHEFIEDMTKLKVRGYTLNSERLDLPIFYSHIDKKEKETEKLFDFQRDLNNKINRIYQNFPEKFKFKNEYKKFKQLSIISYILV